MFYAPNLKRGEMPSKTKCNKGKYVGVLFVASQQAVALQNANGTYGGYDCLEEAKKEFYCRAEYSGYIRQAFRLYVINTETHEVAATVGTETLSLPWTDNEKKSA